MINQDDNQMYYDVKSYNILPFELSDDITCALPMHLYVHGTLSPGNIIRSDVYLTTTKKIHRMETKVSSKVNTTTN